MKNLNVANKITVTRILAVPVFIAVILYYSPQKDYLRYWALGIFLFAVISDVIDGYIARSQKQRTKVGAILDPLADKLLLVSAFVFLYFAFDGNRFPIWLVVCVISRDVILVIGAMVIHLVHGNLKIVPSFWGKATTFFQVLSVLALLLQWPFSLLIWSVTFGLTLVSGIDYLCQGIKILNNGANTQ